MEDLGEMGLKTWTKIAIAIHYLIYQLIRHFKPSRHTAGFLYRPRLEAGKSPSRGGRLRTEAPSPPCIFAHIKLS
jgi:hypothetical protein